MAEMCSLVTNPLAVPDIKVVTCKYDWVQVEDQLNKEVQSVGAVGFDCEWVHVNGKRRPVALLQLATPSGLCVLVRLSSMKSNIPDSLKSLLVDKSIIKCGVECMTDSQHLYTDYGISVNGSLDLRHLHLLTTTPDYPIEKYEPKQCKNKIGLSALTKAVLGRCLDKDRGIIKSDWEAEDLTPSQLKYAADDALSGIQVYLNLVAKLGTSPDLFIPFIDQRFPLKTKNMCKLLASNDELLGYSEQFLAHWYVDNGLGSRISEEQIAVRLNIDPEEGYNVCFVCGFDQSIIWKDIIPFEYRKYFLKMLNDHKIHDVVLLCLPCLGKNIMHDNNLKYQLAEQFHAPIGEEGEDKVSYDIKLKPIKNAAKALHRSGKVLHPDIAVCHENVLKGYFMVEKITDNLIEKAMKLEVFDSDHEPHAFRVYKAYNKIGIMEFENMWREHFLTKMQPIYMPDYWSIIQNDFNLGLNVKPLPNDDPKS